MAHSRKMTTAARIIGAIVGSALIFLSVVFVWIGYKSAVFVDSSTSLFEKLFVTITTSSHPVLYAAGGIVGSLVIGSVILWLTFTYIPRGRLLSWNEYFDDIHAMRKEQTNL